MRTKGRGDMEGVDGGCPGNGMDGTGGGWGKATSDTYMRYECDGKGTQA